MLLAAFLVILGVFMLAVAIGPSIGIGSVIFAWIFSMPVLAFLLSMIGLKDSAFTVSFILSTLLAVAGIIYRLNTYFYPGMPNYPGGLDLNEAEKSNKELETKRRYLEEEKKRLEKVKEDLLYGPQVKDLYASKGTAYKIDSKTGMVIGKSDKNN